MGRVTKESNYRNQDLFPMFARLVRYVHRAGIPPEIRPGKWPQLGLLFLLLPMYDVIAKFGATYMRLTLGVYVLEGFIF